MHFHPEIDFKRQIITKCDDHKNILPLFLFYSILFLSHLYKYTINVWAAYRD